MVFYTMKIIMPTYLMRNQNLSENR